MCNSFARRQRPIDQPFTRPPLAIWREATTAPRGRRFVRSALKNRPDSIADTGTAASGNENSTRTAPRRKKRARSVKGDPSRLVSPTTQSDSVSFFTRFADTGILCRNYTIHIHHLFIIGPPLENRFDFEKKIIKFFGASR